MNTAQHLWMQAHVAIACDSEMTIRGNGHYGGAVVATLETLFPGFEEPSRADLIAYMNENNMADEVEYLMEE